MSSSLFERVVRYQALFLTIARSPVNSFRTWTSIKTFAESANIGSGINKILIRFADLANILTVVPDKLPVLEFGSGSSSLFFLANRKVISLTTYEEKSEFLPTPPSKFLEKWQVVSDKFRVELEDSCEVTRFIDFEQYLAETSLIYIDGPSTPLSPITHKTLPNTEILRLQNLGKHFILVDGRHETVSLIREKTSSTHYFLPSLSFRSIDRAASNQELDSPRFLMSRRLKNVRTSTFIPRSLL